MLLFIFLLAPGEDRIPYEFYKNTPAAFKVLLINIFNQIFNICQVPQSFKSSIIFPLFKKGDPEMAENYRGISFCNTVGKLFSGILLNRITKWVKDNKILRESQAGFRQSYSTIDNIFNLKSIIKIRLSKKRQKAYAFFVDFSAAFDRVDRNCLFYKLATLGLSSKVRNIIRAMYSGTTGRVWSKLGLTRMFESLMGVKQGDILSPLLFALFINDLEENMIGGIKIGGKTIKLLAFADDIVLLAPNAAVLQVMINYLDKYCMKWNLSVNIDKSKIMVFRNGGRPAKIEKWWYRGMLIDVVKEFKYLGVLFTSTLNLEQHFKNKVSAAKMALNNFNSIIMNNDVPLNSKLQIFNAVFRSSISYAAQAWGAKQYDHIELLQKYFIKRVLRLPIYTPDYLIYLETGIWPLFVYTLELHLRYKNRCLELSEDRYPNFFMHELIKRKLFCYEDWSRLEKEFGVSVEEITKPGSNIQEIVEIVKSKLGNSFKEKLYNSSRSILYKDIYLKENYTNDYIYDSKFKASEIGWIFKVRGELMYLNKYAFKVTNGICSLCNMGEVEDIWHFVARCPILDTLRLKFLGKKLLNGEDFLGLQKNEKLKSLAEYCKYAWKYRYNLVTHFNY